MNRLLTLCPAALLVGATATRLRRRMSRSRRLMQAATALAHNMTPITPPRSRWHGPRSTPRTACCRTVRLDRTWPAGPHDYMQTASPPVPGAMRSKSSKRMSRAMVGMPYQFTVTVAGAKWQSSAKTAASSWSIDATPMDGTCASSEPSVPESADQ